MFLPVPLPLWRPDLRALWDLAFSRAVARSRLRSNCETYIILIGRVPSAFGGLVSQCGTLMGTGPVCHAVARRVLCTNGTCPLAPACSLHISFYTYTPIYFPYTVRAVAMSSVPLIIARPSEKSVIS